jgi:hypothetical protein
MKITGPDNLQPSQPGSPQPSERLHKTSEFRDMLRGTLDPSDGNNAVQKSASLSEPHAIHTAGRQIFQSNPLTDRAQQAIDLLDAYSKALADPQKSLRDIEPELTAFVSEAQTLWEDYLGTDRDDPQLKSILEDIQRTARLEGIRFQRGDYLDTE